MKQILFILFMTLTIIAWPAQNALAQGADDHDHEEHGQLEDHAHDEEHEHDEDGGSIDGHSDHEGHQHGQDEEASGEDEHAHGAEDEHEGHEHGHDDTEGQTQIAQQYADQAGVKLSTAGQGIIAQQLPLTGQIVLNGDTTANIRARFPGIVRDVPVRLGQAVDKGQVLARVESNESLKDYAVLAPVSGVVLARNTNAGDVAGDGVLFTIADLSSVWAKFHVFPKDATQIRESQSVKVNMQDAGLQADAPIKLLLPTADALSQTYIAIVEIDNSGGKWRPGVTVEGHVGVSENQVAISVPLGALQNMEEGKALFVKAGDVYETRFVKTGLSDGVNVEITSGLEAGENYVSEGSFIIKADIMKSGAGHDHAH